jgi:hypothetical protein
MFAAAAPALAAANFVGGGGDDLWSNGANWSPAGVPTLASGALSVNANASVQTNLADRIGGVLNVNSGNELIINADFGHALSQTNFDTQGGGTITQNAGNVYFSDDSRPAGGTYNMNGGTFVNRDYYRYDSPSAINITGGSFTIGNYLRINGGTGTVKVVGLTSAGNAAGTGARIALCNVESRREIERVVGQITKVETAIEPKFQEHFGAANAVPHKTDQFPELFKIITLPSPNFNAGSGGGGGGRRRRRG